MVSMEITEFIKSREYLYHLTDERNVALILAKRKLISTQEIVNISTLTNSEKAEFLRNKRVGHKSIILSKSEDIIQIRDQDPISMKSLARAAKVPGDFLEILNQRVFFWPTLKDLNIHFERYRDEKPIILRFSTADIVELNSQPEFCHLNSGAPRCSPHYGGNPAPRDRSIFKIAQNFDLPKGRVREFTLVGSADLPLKFWKSSSPLGPWEEV